MKAISEIREKFTKIEPKHRVRTYPYIGISFYTGVVVLFIDSKQGTVISGNGIYSPGLYLKDWVEDNFEPLSNDKEIVLRNEA